MPPLSNGFYSTVNCSSCTPAQAFGARHTFFVTNGTSTANKVIMQQLLGAGGKVILDQACHKSVHHAVVLFGAEPVYLPASLNPRFGFYGPVPRQRVLAAFSQASMIHVSDPDFDEHRFRENLNMHTSTSPSTP